MKLIILENYSQASEWAAKYIRNRIVQFGPGPGRFFTLGLPTGSTPLGCYRKLVEYYRNGDLSFKYVKTFNMDEYVGECCAVAFVPALQSLAVPQIQLCR